MWTVPLRKHWSKVVTTLPSPRAVMLCTSATTPASRKNHAFVADTSPEAKSIADAVSASVPAPEPATAPAPAPAASFPPSAEEGSVHPPTKVVVPVCFTLPLVAAASSCSVVPNIRVQCHQDCAPQRRHTHTHARTHARIEGRGMRERRGSHWPGSVTQSHTGKIPRYSAPLWYGKSTPSAVCQLSKPL